MDREIENEEWMTPKRRFLSALLGGRVDRTPVGSITSVATIEQMEQTGAYFPEAHYDGEEMARLAEGAHTILGYDCIMPYYSVWVDAAALGMEVNWGDRLNLPDGTGNDIWHHPKEVDIPEDFLERRETNAVLEAISLLRDAHPDVAIVGKVMGPWTLALHVAGIRTILLATRRDPDLVHRFLEALKDASVEFANAQIKAGADVLAVADHTTGDLVSAKDYRDFLLPVHKEITKKIGAPLVLHTCGDTIDRMGYIADGGFDCFHYDSKNDAADAREAVGDRISLMGNINNPETLLYGTSDDVRRAAEYALSSGTEVLAPECAIPTQVKNENLISLVDAARRYKHE